MNGPFIALLLAPAILLFSRSGEKLARSRLELAHEPGAGEVPVAADGAGGGVQDLGGLFFGEASEVAEFYDSGCAGGARATASSASSRAGRSLTGSEGGSWVVRHGEELRGVTLLEGNVAKGDRGYDPGTVLAAV